MAGPAVISRDPGLQPERTALSWRRTGWSMLIPALLCLRGWSQSDNLLYLLSGMLLLCGMVVTRCDFIRNRHYIVSLAVVTACLSLLVMTVGHFGSCWR